MKEKIINGLVRDLNIANERLLTEEKEAEILILKKIIQSIEANLVHFGSLK